MAPRDALTPSVTVVVAARNAAGTLADAVRSALTSRAVLQCVVVDDASDDDTAPLAEQLAAEDPRVEVLRRRARGGPSSARNDGLARARGAFVCFLDADDELVAGGLELLAAAISSTRGAVAALGRFRAIDDAREAVDVGVWGANQLRPVVRRAGAMIESPAGMVPEALVSRLVSPPPGAWLVVTGTARALGGFDQAARRSEDLELLVRLAATGSIVRVEHEVLDYRRHPSQRSAAHSRRRWGRAHTLWLMLRAAPGPADRIRLARGMVAYHLDLFATRRGAPTLAVRAMAVRNLLVASGLRCAGLVAAVLPRRILRPIAVAAAAAVD